MRRLLTYLPGLLTALLLVVCLIAWYATRDQDPGHTTAKQNSTKNPSPVDDRLLRTAIDLGAGAGTAEEQAFAQQAFRAADQELDQAFASAIREASAPAPAPSGRLKELSDRIARQKANVSATGARVARAEKAKDADELELANAQLALDQDELEDAQQDFVRQGGDTRAQIEHALQDHLAVRHKPQPPAPTTSDVSPTLAGQIRAWLRERERGAELDEAQRQATATAAAHQREHDAIEQQLDKKPVAAPSATAAADDEEEDTSVLLARIRKLSDRTKSMAELDKRHQSCVLLADVYGRWRAFVDARREGIMHLMLGSFAIILGIVLAALLIHRAIRIFLVREGDRRRLHQARVITTLATQALAVVAILLVVFGAPTQISTIIGLTTAGLTVALKDFIVAFFGWFALIGKNGIRIGDWVEIEGVGGEVIEIGLLKTVLLEMGNWTNTGHPTGRKVAFVNKYAIENHFFNFSTAGQWLWDELQVTLPLSSNPYALAQQIREVVERETQADALEAEQDWRRVTSQYGTRSFSAKPALDLRPSVNGLDVILRYITRAPQRYEVKTRLFEAIVGMLHQPSQ